MKLIGKSKWYEFRLRFTAHDIIMNSIIPFLVILVAPRTFSQINEFFMIIYELITDQLNNVKFLLFFFKWLFVLFYFSHKKIAISITFVSHSKAKSKFCLVLANEPSACRYLKQMYSIWIKGTRATLLVIMNTCQLRV